MMLSLKQIAAVFVAAAWLSTQSSAKECGGANDPCAISSGSYHLALPRTETPRGIVMHLHGGGGTGKAQFGSGLAKEALARGYVFVAPNGEHPENR